jgi:hypothetical protein
MSFKHAEIKASGPASVSQGPLWEKLELQMGARLSQNEREAVERAAFRLLAKKQSDARKREREAVAALAVPFVQIADAARAALKAERAERKEREAREAQTWAAFRHAPAFREAFTPSGRIATGWVLVNGQPCYLPAALAALAESRGVQSAADASIERTIAVLAPEIAELEASDAAQE